MASIVNSEAQTSIPQAEVASSRPSIPVELAQLGPTDDARSRAEELLALNPYVISDSEDSDRDLCSRFQALYREWCIRIPGERENLSSNNKGEPSAASGTVNICRSTAASSLVTSSDSRIGLPGTVFTAAAGGSVSQRTQAAEASSYPESTAIGGIYLPRQSESTAMDGICRDLSIS